MPKGTVNITYAFAAGGALTPQREKPLRDSKHPAPFHDEGPGKSLKIYIAEFRQATRYYVDSFLAIDEPRAGIVLVDRDGEIIGDVSLAGNNMTLEGDVPLSLGLGEFKKKTLTRHFEDHFKDHSEDRVKLLVLLRGTPYFVITGIPREAAPS